MVELEHLDETRKDVVEQSGTRQWNTTLWAQQNHKIKIFSMGDIVIQFPKGKKKHIEKFLKRFGLPNNIVLLVNIDKFEPNPILVNINKLKPYRYLGKAPKGLRATIEGGGEHKEEDSQKGF